MKNFTKFNRLTFLSLVLWSMFSINTSWAQCASYITPASTTITNIKATAATFTWPGVTETPVTGRYNFEVRTSGEAGTGATGLVASGNADNGIYSTTINGLNFNTLYYFYVRYRCTLTEAADWQLQVNAKNFTTTALLPPVATAAVNVTDVSFIAKWNPVAGASSYRLDVSTNIGFTAIIPSYNDRVVNANFCLVNPPTPDQITPSTVYYYRVRAVGSGNGTPPSVFTTANSNTRTVLTADEPVDFVTWNGSSWTPIEGPSIGKDVVINGDFDTSLDGGGFQAKNLIITEGFTLTITEFNYVLADVQIINNGEVIVENNANLVQNSNTAVNIGNIIVKRNSSSLFRLDYTMWSSPLLGSQTLKEFSPDTVDDRFYTYNSATNLFNTYSPTTNIFEPGHGYLIRMPNDWVTNNGSNPPAMWKLGSFDKGVPNNGTLEVTLVPATTPPSGPVLNGYNMIGNPYPAVISADLFIDKNVAIITGTIYFWRRTNSTLGGATNSYYATYTKAGGVKSTSSEVPNGLISTGQGFIVQDLASGTNNKVKFENNLRAEVAESYENQFFRSSKAVLANAPKVEIERNRVWLNLTNDSGVFNQMLLGYVEGATNELETYDGLYLSNGEPQEVAMGTVIDGSNYVIQGRALPFKDTDVVPMYLKTPLPGTFTITLAEMDGLFLEGQNVFIKDKLTNTTHDIKAGPYTFATEAGVFTDRFEVVYTSLLSTKNPTLDANAVVVYKNNQGLNINSGAIAMKSVELYDMSGRVIYKKNNVDATKLSISNLNFQDQIIIIKINTEAGIVNKKFSFTR